MVNKTKKMLSVEIEIDPEQNYSIENLSLLTGYSTGYIRNLERKKKIPLANRDPKGWRFWRGTDVVSIVNRCREQHHNTATNSLYNQSKK